MIRDPLRRLPIAARFGLAALLCLLPLGQVWSSYIIGGMEVPGYCNDDGLCVPGVYIPGSSSVTSVAQAPIRLFLVAAAAGLLVCAVRVRTVATLRIASVAVAAATAAALLAAGHRSTSVLLPVLAALLLAAPPVLAGRRALAKRSTAP